jgi:hypothetical protein
MDLMPIELQRLLEKHPLYSAEHVRQEETKILVKYFTPDAEWTWYVVEGQKEEDGDWLLFGYVIGFEREWGYFRLSELKEAKGPLGLPIERDLHFEGKTIGDILGVTGKEPMTPTPSNK